ncbi:DUF4129 domain-containing protein [Actinopolymorpha rutila]|uniref:Protein-glutamine gamma-glutamyltransferase-like C-terminal domain-containing protein n=1 Tax=Actinopolymorpha rutila TaxID=446787 RepID=A0A852ZQB2_9ACTN|nr:hypothetical protein [Actinopolymorpha rutila]
MSALVSGSVGRLPGEPPIDIGGADAARAARDELTKGIYHRDEPGLVSRVLVWARDWLADVFGRIAAVSPGGWWGLVALAAVVVLAVVVVRWRVGALARTRARTDGTVFAGTVRSAAEYREAARAAAARDDHEAAVRDGFRALVRELEERTFLDERPGRTADEVAREGSVIAPEAAASLRTAAREFDEVCYGGRVATVRAYDEIRAADDAVRRIRRPAGAAGAVPVGGAPR